MEDFHREMKKKDIKDNNYTCTTLINAYTQADMYEQALKIFYRMH